MDSENSDSTHSGADSGDDRTNFGWSGLLQPSTAVAEAVATATDREPTELEPIHESIDTDALDTLVAPTESRDSVRISFRYEGVIVFVDSQHGIEVRPGEGDGAST